MPNISLEKYPQNLETRINIEKKSCNEEVRNEIPDFTQDEVQAAIDNVKKGKASDNHGIRAEDIKTCDDTTKEMIRQIFNEVLKQEDCTPNTWRRNSYKSDLQQRNVEEVGNYRPILRSASALQTVLNNHIQQTLPQTRPSAIKRPGRI